MTKRGDPMHFVAFAAAVLLACTAALCIAGEPGSPVIYPAKGQDPWQQDRDRYECHSWARGQSGFDPAQPATAAATATVSASASAGTGAMVRGAMGGAAVAELAHRDVGRGAAAGVVAGSIASRLKQPQQQQSASAQRKSTYDRAFGACLDARGYVVR